MSPTKFRPIELAVARIFQKTVVLPVLSEHGLLSGETQVDTGLLETIDLLKYPNILLPQVTWIIQNCK